MSNSINGIENATSGKPDNGNDAISGKTSNDSGENVISNNPSDNEGDPIMDLPKKQKPPKRPYSSKQKIAIATAAVILAAGLIGGGAWLILRPGDGAVSSSKQASTVVSSGQTITLVDGKNKIESGGTYTFTGSTRDGKIVVNTDDEVKIILDNVSITNPSGAAIKCKGTGKVTIELVGENALTSTDTGSTEDDDGPANAISSDADLEITGEGSATVSANGKGIKADGTLTLKSGTCSIRVADDAIHSNDTVIIEDGAYTINAGDDGIHADNTLTINGGTIAIEQSYEGLEADVITINGGDINLTASDDGINAASGSTDSVVMGHPGSAASSTSKLIINGGTLYVNASGDGLDSNGSIEMSGGTVYVDGPVSDGDGALDYDGTMTITGGTLVATGASGMAMNASSATQPSVLVNLSGTYSGTVSLGGVSFTPTKTYRSVMISSPDLTVGDSYDLIINGQTVQTVTISQNIVGQGSGMMGGGMGGMRGEGGEAGENGGNGGSGDPQSSQGGRMMRGGMR